MIDYQITEYRYDWGTDIEAVDQEQDIIATCKISNEGQIMWFEKYKSEPKRFNKVYDELWAEAEREGLRLKKQMEIKNEFFKRQNN
ncbi:MAG: hypothetical protein ACR2MR_13625 [Dietzia maris]